MDNQQIAAVFRHIADLLELKDENPFKIRAYRLAADTIEDYPESMKRLAAQGAKALQAIHGIGKSISANIIELVETGSCSAYRHTVSEVPESALDLLEVSGVGLKTAQKLVRDYQVYTIDQLEAFARSGHMQMRLNTSQRTIERILKSIGRLKDERGPSPQARAS